MYDTAEEALAATKSKHAVIRAEKKAKPTPEAWRRIWLDELKKYYPAYLVSYSDAVAANLKCAVKNRGLPAEDVGRLIAWVISSWPLLRKIVFSFNPKVPRGPDAPDMELVIKYLPRIYGLFNAAKPEHALTMPRSAPPIHVPATILQPAAINAPKPLLKRPSIDPLRTVVIDHKAADVARQKLGLKKWGET